jgi:hypothetical protein
MHSDSFVKAELRCGFNLNLFKCPGPFLAFQRTSAKFDIEAPSTLKKLLSTEVTIICIIYNTLAISK